MKQNRRSRERGAEGYHTANETLDLLNKQEMKCAYFRYCGTALDNGYEEDHIIALINGGTNWINNIQLCCRSCNRQKTDKDELEFMRSKGWLF